MSSTAKFPVPTEPGFYWARWIGIGMPEIVAALSGGDHLAVARYGYIYPTNSVDEFTWLSGPLHPPGSEWQPIETAPKDGTRVLILEGGEQFVGRCYYQRWTTIPGDWRRLPTHWMPLPAPPGTP